MTTSLFLVSVTFLDCDGSKVFNLRLYADKGEAEETKNRLEKRLAYMLAVRGTARQLLPDIEGETMAEKDARMPGALEKCFYPFEEEKKFFPKMAEMFNWWYYSGREDSVVWNVEEIPLEKGYAGEVR